MHKIIAIFLISLSVSIVSIGVYHVYNKIVMHEKLDCIIKQLNKIDYERRYCK